MAAKKQPKVGIWNYLHFGLGQVVIHGWLIHLNSYPPLPPVSYVFESDTIHWVVEKYSVWNFLCCFDTSRHHKFPKTACLIDGLSATTYGEIWTKYLGNHMKWTKK